MSLFRWGQSGSENFNGSVQVTQLLCGKPEAKASRTSNVCYREGASHQTHNNKVCVRLFLRAASVEKLCVHPGG